MKKRNIIQDQRNNRNNKNNKINQKKKQMIRIITIYKLIIIKYNKNNINYNITMII